MKYIILERSTLRGTQRVPIIFPSDLVHKHVADAITNGNMGQAYGFTGVVLSAGEIESQSLLIRNESISNSLDIGPQPSDQDTIFMNDYMHGFDSVPTQVPVATKSPTPENWETTEQVITSNPDKRTEHK